MITLFGKQCTLLRPCLWAVLTLIHTSPTYAQRTLYETDPDFDQSYCLHKLIYTDEGGYGIGLLPHINQFYSKHAKANKIRSYIMVYAYQTWYLEFDEQGFLLKRKMHLIPMKDNEARNYDQKNDSIIETYTHNKKKTITKYYSFYQGQNISNGITTFHFNKGQLIDSMITNYNDGYQGILKYSYNGENIVTENIVVTTQKDSSLRYHKLYSIASSVDTVPTHSYYTSSDSLITPEILYTKTFGKTTKCREVKISYENSSNNTISIIDSAIFSSRINTTADRHIIVCYRWDSRGLLKEYSNHSYNLNSLGRYRYQKFHLEIDDNGIIKEQYNSNGGKGEFVTDRNMNTITYFK